ncbi:hemolysin secretion protein D [Streptosporangium jomthongense]|uniref:Efflux RND transporter periplasmic adaptor subunit n=1 Tax=Marinobacter aromaticivorans TaxID=1494078 RepID=A0ABW2ITL3_9GAMM|nr:efflux RND transporter periplasmic adaptor subunit [Marinobacter aromaticivorans]GGE59668.1 hemolysin secretion protein D [Streptosporangium jomthongense]
MTTDNDPSLKDMAKEVNSVIRAEKKRGRFSVLAWVALGVVFIAGLAWWFWPEDTRIQWQTHRLDRADMVLTAMATGNLQPKSEVSVGAEISGLVSEVLVSENDEILRGQVLARFDTEELEVALLQATAGLELARASLAEAAATLEEALVDERRTESLVERGNSPQATLDKAVATRKRAEARSAYARATVRQAEATVSQARTRLEKAVITSPIDGVVLQRSIEPGATVAANFQTPVLFLLAEDLGQMELHVSMDEADVGLVKAGQSATFSVDAWSGREFEAEVLKVYLYPTVENNVVTYTTVLAVDNSAHLLQPGMTATATINTGQRDQALRVPNIAFRFTPPATEAESGGMFSHPASRGRGGAQGTSNTLWVLEDEEPRRVLVRSGYTDGQYTEVLSDELSEGDEVLTGIMRGSVE